MLLKRLLWVDCASAAVAGTAVLALSRGLGRLEGLPPNVLRLTGAVNLLYAVASGTLALRRRRTAQQVGALSAANLVWASVCPVLLVAFAAKATPVAAVHLLGEAAYVGGMGVLEWRHRARLATPA